jgi:N-formylmaleamate deformylase
VELIAATEVTPASRIVRANGLRLHSVEYGSGEGDAVVVVPGITTPAAGVAFLGRALAERSRAILLDLRGRGLSDRADSYRLADYAADLEGVLAALELEHPVLLGHSMGARIVAELAVTHPARARALVLVDPPVSGPGRAPYPFPLEMYLEQLAAARAGTMTIESLRAQLPVWTDEQLQARLKSLPTCDEHAIVESYRSFHDEDFFPAWRALHDPVLLVRGADSPVVPDGALDELRAANPGVSIVSIPGAGHMVPWDAPDLLLAEVWRFLEGAA